MGTLGILSFVLMAMAGQQQEGINLSGVSLGDSGWCCQVDSRTGTLSPLPDRGYFQMDRCDLCGATASLPEDVPAVQEEQEYEDHLAPLENCKSEHVEGTQPFYVQVCEYHKTKQLVWTCPDPHAYALLTSVDGQVRVCHRLGAR